MKLKSLLLGSVAAAGLSTGAFAADANVLTSLNVCDLLGLSGLTISSDTNCLQITGGVSYTFNWGDYSGTTNLFGALAYDNSNVSVDAAAGGYDWSSEVVSWLQFVGTADSDFGPAKAVIKLKNDSSAVYVNSVSTTSSDYTVVVDQAYVAVGDSTILMAGKKGSILNTGDDEPFNFLGLFNSSAVDAGVGYDAAGSSFSDGGEVIQVTSDLGNGVSIGGGLEALNTVGSAVGVMTYAGDTVSAHASFIASGILDGVVDNWGIHAGMTATVDQFKIRGAVAANDTGWWNVLGSAQATFDMFTLAVSAEATSASEMGFGASAGATVADGVSVNAGFRWFDPDTTTANDEGWQAAAQLVAAVTETVTVTAEAGLYGTGSAAVTANASVFYGSAKLAWAPGGGFSSSVKGQMNSEGAYKVTFNAAKSFE